MAKLKEGCCRHLGRGKKVRGNKFQVMVRAWVKKKEQSKYCKRKGDELNSL